MGWMIAVTMALGVGCGIWFDQTFKKAPLGVLLGSFLAFATTGYLLWRMIQKQDRREKEKTQQKSF